MIHLQNGFPSRDDITAALQAFTSTHSPKSRPDELYLKNCPVCKSNDDRKETPQGAISYSLALNCLTCAKCGKSVGWKETLEALNVEWTAGDDVPVRHADVKSLAERARAAGRAASPKKADDEDAYVDHGDLDLDVGVAADHHVRRLMAEGSLVKPWLEKRGFVFNSDYAENLNSCWAGESKAGWLVLIYRGVDGEIRGFKYRNIETKEFFAQRGVQSEPYGIDEIDPENLTRTVVEGEIDRETLKIVYGIKNVLSLPNGANSWNPRWVKYFEGAETVYVATDADDEGEKVAAKMFTEIPKTAPTVQRTLRVYFSDARGVAVKDANDALKGGATVEQVRQAFLDACDPDIRPVTGMEGGTDRRMISSHWPPFDDVLGGGLLTGNFTHMSGPPKSGKSTLVAGMLHNQASRSGKVAFIGFDMSSGQMSVRLGMALLGRSESDFYRCAPDSADRAGYQQLFVEALRETYKGNLLISGGRGRVRKYAEAIAMVERAARAGARLVAVEDYLSLASMYEKESKGKSMFSGRVIGDSLVDVAERSDCHILLINHTKGEDGGVRTYGEGQIGPLSQVNIHVRARRDKNGVTKDVVMHVTENRFNSISDVDIALSFGADRVLVAGGHVRHKKKGKGEEWKGQADF